VRCHPCGVTFEKNFLFDGKSIRKEKGTVKKKDGVQGKETRGGLWRKRDYSELDFTDTRR
jgi:hypothetical protein